MNENHTITDFNTDDLNWYIVNDGVMGGLSKSDIYLKEEGIAVFSGEISLENNGGFASTRMTMEETLPSGYQYVTLRIKGDGNIYNFRIRVDQNFDGLAYDYEFETTKDEWIEVKIPLDKVQGTFRGRKFPDKVGIQSEQIGQIGILVGNKQKGKFKIEMDYIKLSK